MFLRITTALASALLILCSTSATNTINTEAPDLVGRDSATVALTNIAEETITAVHVPTDAAVSFSLIDLPPSVRAVKPPVKPVEVVPEEIPVEVIPTPPVQTPPPAIPAPPVAPPLAPPAPAGPEVRYINVALAGGQDVIDWEAGPVLFPLPGNFPPYIAEHDFAGGWARFGTLSAGMQVNMSGLVTGTYTVGQIINVPKGGSTAEFSAFATMPKVMLQTCIPGTSRMIVVGLY